MVRYSQLRLQLLDCRHEASEANGQSVYHFSGFTWTKLHNAS